MNGPPLQYPPTLQILCIEDHPLDREIIRRQLGQRELWGGIQIDVLWASCLKEAFSLLDHTTVDVCVVDLFLPDSKGIATIHAIKNQSPQTSIVVVTADETELTVRQAVYANVHGYLVKGEYTARSLVRSIIAAWERAQLERRLADTLEHLRQWQIYSRALLEYHPDGVIMIDSEGKILYINAAAQSLLGYSNEALLVKELVQASQPSGSDLVIPQRDGKLCYVSLRIQPAIIEGREVTLFFLHDVTERRLFEKQTILQHHAELVNTLAGGIAHDLNNLFSPIMLGVQTLMRMIDDDRTRQVLSIIEQSARRGAELVRQVHNYSLQQRTPDTILYIPKIISDIAAQFVATLPSRITLDISGVDSQLPPFFANALQIEQIVRNLLSNARDAIGENNGTIQLYAYRVTSDDTRLKSKGVAYSTYVAIEVKDSGMGIPEEIQMRIFEPFFTTKPKGQGEGLGLYIVLNHIKHLRGTIHIDSCVGKGTTVTVFIPYQDSYDSAQGYSVLVISSSATMRHLLDITLTQHGYITIQASTSTEAISYLTKAHPNLECIIVDYDEEARESPDDLRILKQLKPSLRMIVLCNLVVQQSLVELEGNVIDYFLAKPIASQSLLDALEAGIQATRGFVPNIP